MNSLKLKPVIATATQQDRQSIYTIRHSIYAEELEQYKTNSSGRLQDDLDKLNHYIVAKDKGQVIGFISITSPASGKFSIDKYFDRSELPFSFDGHLYEIRILSVTKEHRNSSLAYILMYAAMRWVEAHGGKNIVAICRSELLDMYSKIGLKPLGFSTRSGALTYELSHATLNDFHNWVSNKYELFKALSERIEWKLPFSFFTPSPCYHGGAFFKAIGEDLQTLQTRDIIINADVLDAWFPPSPKVIESLQKDLAWLLQTSPPTHCKGLAEAIAKARGVDETSILPGGGSSDLIFLALQHFLHSGSRVLVLDPCYGEYRHVLDKIIQCSVTTFQLKKEDGFVVDTDSLLEEILQGYDMVILVNPNNPTGLHIPKEKMQEMLSQVPADTLVWIDETYIEYVGTAASLEQFATQTENIIVCKSMSKVYALSGARIGYLCCAPHLIETLQLLMPPWPVSLPSQLAAITSLQDDNYYQKKYYETCLLREKMRLDLIELGMESVIEGMANFILFYLPADISSVVDFVEGCKRHNLYIRDVSTMGTTLGKGAVRIAVKDEKTNEKIMDVMRLVMGIISKIGVYP